jgi:hypothetical protein
MIEGRPRKIMIRFSLIIAILFIAGVCIFDNTSSSPTIGTLPYNVNEPYISRSKVQWMTEVGILKIMALDETAKYMSRLSDRVYGCGILTGCDKYSEK